MFCAESKKKAPQQYPNFCSTCMVLYILHRTLPLNHVSSIQFGNIRRFWPQNIRQEKLMKFIKFLELYQVFIYNFLYQNVLILSDCILPTRTKNISLTFNTYQSKLAPLLSRENWTN